MSEGQKGPVVVGEYVNEPTRNLISRVLEVAEDREEFAKDATPRSIGAWEAGRDAIAIREVCRRLQEAESRAASSLRAGDRSGEDGKADRLREIADLLDRVNDVGDLADENRDAIAAHAQYLRGAASARRGDEPASVRLTLRGLQSLTDSFAARYNATRSGVMIPRDMACALLIELQDKLSAAGDRREPDGGTDEWADYDEERDAEVTDAFELLSAVAQDYEGSAYALKDTPGMERIAAGRSRRATAIRSLADRLPRLVQRAAALSRREDETNG